jgi:hypothetical protein
MPAHNNNLYDIDHKFYDLWQFIYYPIHVLIVNFQIVYNIILPQELTRK